MHHVRLHPIFSVSRFNVCQSKSYSSCLYTIHALANKVFGHMYSVFITGIECAKELSFCHKLWFNNLFIFATQFRRPLIFHNMTSVKLNNLSLKYQSCTPTFCKDSIPPPSIKEPKTVNKFGWIYHKYH